jgi:hypothetical protein
MELPIATWFVDKSSGKSVLGLVQIATGQDLLRWTGWRYRATDGDRAWDWRSIHRECIASDGFGTSVTLPLRWMNSRNLLSWISRGKKRLLAANQTERHSSTVKQRINLEKAAEAETFGALAVSARSKHRGVGSAREGSPKSRIAAAIAEKNGITKTNPDSRQARCEVPRRQSRQGRHPRL